MNELKQTNLELKYLKREGVSTKTNKPYCFNELYVVVKGIPIKLLPLVGDQTGKTIIEEYIKELEGGNN